MREWSFIAAELGPALHALAVESGWEFKHKANTRHHRVPVAWVLKSLFREVTVRTRGPVHPHPPGAAAVQLAHGVLPPPEFEAVVFFERKDRAWVHCVKFFQWQDAADFTRAYLLSDDQAARAIMRRGIKEV